jgi:hypothetical protein
MPEPHQVIRPVQCSQRLQMHRQQQHTEALLLLLLLLLLFARCRSCAAKRGCSSPSHILSSVAVQP